MTGPVLPLTTDLSKEKRRRLVKSEKCNHWDSECLEYRRDNHWICTQDANRGLVDHRTIPKNMTAFDEVRWMQPLFDRWTVIGMVMGSEKESCV